MDSKISGNHKKQINQTVNFVIFNEHTQVIIHIKYDDVITLESLKLIDAVDNSACYLFFLLVYRPVFLH